MSRENKTKWFPEGSDIKCFVIFLDFLAFARVLHKDLENVIFPKSSHYVTKKLNGLLNLAATH